MRNLKIHPKFKEKFKIKKGLRKMAKLNRMNTRFQRGAVEIALDLFKGLSLIDPADNPIESYISGNCIRPV